MCVHNKKKGSSESYKEDMGIVYGRILNAGFLTDFWGIEFWILN